MWGYNSYGSDYQFDNVDGYNGGWSNYYAPPVGHAEEEDATPRPEAVPSEVLKPKNAALLLSLSVPERNTVLRWIGKFAEEKQLADDATKNYVQHEASRRRPFKSLVECYVKSSDQHFNKVLEAHNRYKADLRKRIEDSENAAPQWREKCIHFQYTDEGTFLDTWTPVESVEGAYELFNQCRRGKPVDIKRCLKELGPEPIDLCRVRDKRGRSAMHYVAIGGNHEVVDYFLPLINSRDREGWTPMHHAAWLGHRATVEQLEKFGAFVEARDDEGRTPFHYAKTAGMKHTAFALVRIGAMVAKDDAEFLLSTN
eukprot:GEMP01059169.1.p1 GENE.GEMP01059169.1~~GEMP01059169.1.p1  ORF type:complete len:312 (+),score=67.23 GEMP01059169.1:124-1059(+)